MRLGKNSAALTGHFVTSLTATHDTFDDGPVHDRCHDGCFRSRQEKAWRINPQTESRRKCDYVAGIHERRTIAII